MAEMEVRADFEIDDVGATAALARMAMASDKVSKSQDRLQAHLGKFKKVSDSAVKPMPSIWGRLNQRLNQAATSHKGVEKQMDMVREKASGLKEHLMEIAAAVGIGFSAKSVVEKFIDSNAEAEQATRRLGVAIAGVYQYAEAKSPTDNLNIGLKRSTDLMEVFEKKSRALGIPKRELAGMAATLAPAIASAGKGTSELVPVTEKIAVLSRAMGMSYEESAHAMTGAIEFGMARRSPLMQMLGIHGAMLQKMTQAQRAAYIMQKLSRIDTKALSETKTWGDLMGKVRAQVDSIFETGGKPLFERAKKVVSEVADWLDKNQDKVVQISRVVGDFFVEKLNLAVKIVKALYDNLDKIKAIVIGVAGIWASGRIFGGAQAMLGGLDEKLRALGFNAGKQIGMAAKGAMVLEAAAIGYAIGTAINAWLEKQEWWNKLMTPKEEILQQEKQRDLQKQQADAISGIDDWLAYRKKVAPRERTEQSLAFLGKTIERTGGRTGGFGVFSLADIARYRASKGIGLPGTQEGATPVKGERPINFNNARFDITQKFNEGFDPDRIAVAFTNDLAKVGERKLQSGMMHPMAAT